MQGVEKKKVCSGLRRFRILYYADAVDDSDVDYAFNELARAIDEFVHNSDAR